MYPTWLCTYGRLGSFKRNTINPTSLWLIDIYYGPAISWSVAHAYGREGKIDYPTYCLR